MYNTEERHCNIPFDDLITSQKDKDHTRVIFQNVNSLDLSSGHHTLALMCDSIAHYVVDIAYLAETNTNWKHNYATVLFKATTKRHWRHSHSTTSETAIDWSDIYQPGGTTIITLPPFSFGITTSGSDPHGLSRCSYITIISAYRVC